MERILFLCFGNICRSPVAEKLAQRAMHAKKISSAGFYPQEGRHTPESVEKAAESLGLNISDWASRRVTVEMVESADLVVLMDLWNFRDFQREFPRSLDKITLLGLFLDPPQINITDPYNKPPDETEQILRQIEKGVSGLVKELGNGG